MFEPKAIAHPDHGQYGSDVHSALAQSEDRIGWNQTMRSTSAARLRECRPYRGAAWAARSSLLDA